MTALDTIKRDGFIGTLSYDDCPENPRETYDHVSSFTQLSRDFIQPDDNHDENILNAWNNSRTRYHDTELIERYARVSLDAVAVGWVDDPRSDSRVFGYIARFVADREGIDNPQAYLDAELAEYAAWQEGDVYVLTIDTEDGEQLECVGGFYGYDHALAELEALVEYEVNAKRVTNQAMYRRLVNAGK